MSLMEMAMSDSSFLEAFFLAQREALTEREQSVVESRYGIVSGEPQTLEQVAQAFLLSRERIRQLVERSLRKIKHKGKRDLAQGKITGACASLLFSLEQACQPGTPGSLERMITFAQEELPFLPPQTHAFPLLVSLLFKEAEAKQVMAALMQMFAEATADQIQQTKMERYATSFTCLLPGVLWPRPVQTDSHRLAGLIDASLERTSQSETLANGGSFFSQKMKRDVLYRSVIEMQMLLRLEAAAEIVSYQEQPFLITEEAYGKVRTYCPDIFFVLKDGRGVIADITQWTHMALYRNRIRYEAIRLFCVKHGLGLLITDGKKTFKQLRQHTIPPAFQQALLAAIMQSPTQSLSWNQYQAIRDQHSASWMDFLAVVLNNRLIWSLKPFTLKNSTPLETYS
jgi:hypothetical protein